MWKKWAKLRQSITFLIVTTEVHAKRTRFCVYSSVINKHSKLCIHSANVSESICFHLLLTTPSGQPSTCFAYLLAYLPHAVNWIRFCFCAVCDFFVCVWNIPGTAEQICAKFTGKTCLVPHLDEFEGQGQFRRPACGLCLEKNIFVLVIVVN